MKILIIEDEFEMLSSIESALLSQQYVVEKAMDFQSAMEKIFLYEYDCILLDISLPGGSGLQILHQMKEEGKAGNVIIISAKNSIDDKVNGLLLGADDYLTKPFHMAELFARIKAVIRRKNFAGNNVMHIGDLALNYEDRTLFVNDKLVELNRKEFDILSFFAVNLNRLVQRTVLAEHVWGDDIDVADNFDFIYSQIKNIRKKLKSANSLVQIESVYGIGYRMTVAL